MAAGPLNITIETGAKFFLRYFVHVGGASTGRPLTVEEATALPPYNLTGFTVTAQVREAPDSVDALATMTGAAPSPATNGEINLTIASADTALLPVGVYHWDCFITSVGTGPVRLLAGRATVEMSSTR